MSIRVRFISTGAQMCEGLVLTDVYLQPQLGAGASVSVSVGCDMLQS